MPRAAVAGYPAAPLLFASLPPASSALLALPPVDSASLCLCSRPHCFLTEGPLNSRAASLQQGIAQACIRACILACLATQLMRLQHTQQPGRTANEALATSTALKQWNKHHDDVAFLVNNDTSGLCSQKSQLHTVTSPSF